MKEWSDSPVASFTASNSSGPMSLFQPACGGQVLEISQLRGTTKLLIDEFSTKITCVRPKLCVLAYPLTIEMSGRTL
ncbi:hypothetical protein ABZ835_44785 [Streptomyces sp. NPDC047461]|uniref:hypothetical protein n=1 Tax=Streptomyces sp. NPDC047461 TaxID=3155619 RepID=UPI0033DD08B1